ncbi:unnamed protein product [Phaeothamnion confervicola]
MGAELWALALLVASQCPGPAEESHPYQRAARAYADAMLPRGSPLHTMALAFSGQAGSAIRHGGRRLSTFGSPMGAAALAAAGGDGGGRTGGGGEPTMLLDSWRLTAAAVLSNKAGDWNEQLLTLGDRLRAERHDWAAAHACYLAAGWRVERPGRSARLVLPGVDHSVVQHRALSTPQATEALHLLETFASSAAGGSGGAGGGSSGGAGGGTIDGSGRAGGSGGGGSGGGSGSGGGGGRVVEDISTVQGHKLRLAMLLADLGYLEKADAYTKSIRMQVARIPAGSGSGGSGHGAGPYTDKFVRALSVFEDRVCVSLGTRPYVGVGGGGGDGGGGGAGESAGSWLFGKVKGFVKVATAPSSGDLPAVATAGPVAAPLVGGGGGKLVPPRGPEGAGGMQGAYRPVPRPGRTGPAYAVRGGGGVGGGGDGGGGGGGGFEMSGAPAAQHGGMPSAAAPSLPMSRLPSGAGAGSGFGAFTMPAAAAAGGPAPEPTRMPMPNPPQRRATHHGTLSTAVDMPKQPTPDAAGGAWGQPAAQINGSAGGINGRGSAEKTVPEPAAGSAAAPAPASAPQQGLGHSQSMVDLGSAKAAAKDWRGGAGGAPNSDTQAHGQKSASAAVDTNAGGGPGFFKRMLIRAIHPGAKHVDLGEKMEAYYDAKLKRWVFPGEDATTAAADLPDRLV